LNTFQPKYINIEGYAGSQGAALLFEENEALIRSRFRKDYVDSCLRELKTDIETRFSCSTSAKTDIETRFSCSSSASIIEMINDICAQERCGYRLNLRDIPLRQFTIEICELLSVSPYDLPCNAVVTLSDKKTPQSCGCTTRELRKTLLR